MAIEQSGEPTTVHRPVASQSRARSTVDERRTALEEIAAEVRVCTRCRLWQTRTNAVPGEGHPDTEVIFVGEGPGQTEDIQGRPFVGAAGSFLTELIGSVAWQREEVFITNVVKCRPPGNRDPEADEIAACAPYLQRQLAVLDPALVVTLGRHSLQTFMPGARIGAVHGTARPVDPGTGALRASVYAMYHPAAAFRQQALRETLQLDMTGIPAALQSARTASPSQPEPVEPSSGESVSSRPAVPHLVDPEPAEGPRPDLSRERELTPARVPPATEFSDDQLSLFR